MSQRLTYSVSEVAELLGNSRSTAYDCIRHGEIPALVLGRRIVVSRTSTEGAPRRLRSRLPVPEARP